MVNDDGINNDNSYPSIQSESNHALIVDSNCPNVDLISVLCDVTVLCSCFISCDGWTNMAAPGANMSLLTVLSPSPNKLCIIKT
jgi:hypothetical protein